MSIDEITKDDVKKAKNIIEKVLGFKRRLVVVNGMQKWNHGIKSIDFTVNGHRYCCHPHNSSPLGLRYGGHECEKVYEE